MAAENSAEFQDDKEILINKGDVQEVQQKSGAVTESTTAKPSKMTLYHWTQSFSSQKVSVSEPCRNGQLLKGMRGLRD
ncbi:unnamed protein product [Oncorhynchus mykiss]|uniref:Uncharacterized protein n=1 Tax=Oncorhynchus mykiss TaxID=8022 RepID=A0A060YIF9_ONCMY|nr:unnamed protein product [Oncorhynchus mykiss]